MAEAEIVGMITAVAAERETFASIFLVCEIATNIGGILSAGSMVQICGEKKRRAMADEFKNDLTVVKRVATE
ncbi:hypothetical protein [Photobacterium kagoshimensis]|uniref:hypothetical protein n=1 Tax=Photobacterium kagoshimensis TaxID=2910242 RepID=UPI003D139DE3